MKVGVVVLLCLATSAFAALQACNDATLDKAWHTEAVNRWSAQADEVEFQQFRLNTLLNELPANTIQQTGRGAVVVVASKAQVISGYAAAAKLRSVSSLPIEVIHAGAIAEADAKTFESLSGVRVVSVQESSSLLTDAVLQSSFNEVVAMDAQTVALADPAAIFESAEFKANGLSMFPTLHKTASTNPVWSVLGQSCVDSFEQSSSVIVVNKAKAWKALNMAAHLRTDFYQSLTNGDNNVVRIASLATATPFSMNAAAPRVVASNYVVAGVSKSCAHLAVHSVNGVDMFAVSSNAQVESSGSNVEYMNCMETESAVEDEALVNEHIALFNSVPESLYRYRLFTCTAGSASWAQQVAYAAGTFVTYKVDLSTATVGTTYDRTVSSVGRISQCSSSLFSFLSGTSYASYDVGVAFINITTGYGSGKSANVDIATPNALNGNLGNETIIYVNNGAGRTDYDYPILGLSSNSVNYNLATGTSAIIAVAVIPTAAGGQSRSIGIRVTYNGASNDAVAKSVSPVLLAVAAIVAIVANRVFGF